MTDEPTGEPRPRVVDLGAEEVEQVTYAYRRKAWVTEFEPLGVTTSDDRGEW